MSRRLLYKNLLYKKMKGVNELKNISKTGIVIWVICISLIMIALVSILSLQLQINDREEKKEALEKDIQDISERIEELKYEIAKPIDDDYIIKIARERLGYHLPGEKVYVFDAKD